jgi:hypothetical protein
MTPWGFRVETHRVSGGVASELGSWESARLLYVRLVVPTEAATAVRSGLEAVFGPIPGLSVESGDVERATVPAFTIGGSSFPTERVVDVASLATSD